jgi:hypothetical protein|tara:strand:- start:12664 stop:13410 length:747 start_codon:yes stop_codon:yes gene_type:complete
MINSVRNTVLSVLNKNNYGYISPSDFNLFAQQAQMEIYEEYYSSYNKTINAENARVSGTEYADIENPIAEVLEGFLRNDTLLQVAPTTNQYYVPSLITTGYNFYMISRLTCFNGTTRLGDAEKVANARLYMLLDSMLTAPTTKYPSYIIEEDIITVYPDTINGVSSLKCSYFRLPLDPKWTYINLPNGEPAFDQSQPDYQDFELPFEDEYKLVMKILQYCGMSIREIQVAQYGIQQEQAENPAFSTQQ